MAACRPPRFSVFFLSLCASFNSLNEVTQALEREVGADCQERSNPWNNVQHTNSDNSESSTRYSCKRVKVYAPTLRCWAISLRLSPKLPANHRRFPDARSGRASSLHKKHLTKKLGVRLLAPALLLVPACRPVPLLPRTVPLLPRSMGVRLLAPALLLVLACRPVAGGHCGGNGADCSKCVSDSRGSPCSFCDGRCQMAWDACETDAITSSAACPAIAASPFISATLSSSTLPSTTLTNATQVSPLPSSFL